MNLPYLKSKDIKNGMAWDDALKVLWGWSTTDAVDGSRGTAYGIVQGYLYEHLSEELHPPGNYNRLLCPSSVHGVFYGRRQVVGWAL